MVGQALRNRHTVQGVLRQTQGNPGGKERRLSLCLIRVICVVFILICACNVHGSHTQLEKPGKWESIFPIREFLSRLEKVREIVHKNTGKMKGFFTQNTGEVTEFSSNFYFFFQ